jgi:SAM-dependent methyltransferase
MTGYTQIIGREHVTDEERVQLEYRYSQVFETGNVFLEDLRIIVITFLTYAKLTRRRTAADFLPPEARWTGGVSDDSTEENGERPEPCDLGQQNDETGRNAVLACPTCYEISGACQPDECGHECVRSCAFDAISVVNGRAVINDKCVACSECVHACPKDAIDKYALRSVEEGLHCDQCETTYARTNGVYDLLPQSDKIEKSPFFDFYENDYVADNPSMHLEDTEWKVRELRPLLKSDVQYDRMLDLGCGAGVLGRRIAGDLHIPQTVSADWSTQILEVARRQAPDATYVRMDAAYLPFRNRQFDLAMLIDVIEHQHKPDQVLSEIRRVADRLLLRTPLEECWYESMRRRRKDLFRESSGHVVHYDPDLIRRQMRTNGWRVQADSIRHIAWMHWKRVLFGDYPLSGKLTAAARYGLRLVLPISLYRRLFVTNYNAFCEGALRGPSLTGRNHSAGPTPVAERDEIVRKAASPAPMPSTGQWHRQESPTATPKGRNEL